MRLSLCGNESLRYVLQSFDYKITHCWDEIKTIQIFGNVYISPSCYIVFKKLASRKTTNSLKKQPVMWQKQQHSKANQANVKGSISNKNRRYLCPLIWEWGSLSAAYCFQRRTIQPTRKWLGYINKPGPVPQALVNLRYKRWYFIFGILNFESQKIPTLRPTLEY